MIRDEMQVGDTLTVKVGRDNGKTIDKDVEKKILTLVDKYPDYGRFRVDAEGGCYFKCLLWIDVEKLAYNRNVYLDSNYGILIGGGKKY